MTALTPAQRQKRRRQRTVAIRALTDDPAVIAAWKRILARHAHNKTAAIAAAVLAYDRTTR